MFVSIVIPLFNKRDHILRAIRSVLKQTHFDWELIIVDDGSTDGSADVVKTVSDLRIRLFSQPNGGVSKARNAGVRLARAEWVAFLDADDEYEPDFLKRTVEFIREHEPAGLAMVGANYYIATRSHVAVDWPAEDGTYDYFRLFKNQCSPNHSSTTAVNRKKFLETGGFPEGVKQFEDWIAWFKLAFIGDFGFISEPLGIYHCVEESAAKTKRPPGDFFRDVARLLNTIAEYIVKYPLSPVREKEAWSCRNEIAVNMAGLLARDGAKKLALRMLKFVRLRHFTRKRAGHAGFLLEHLIVPQWMKQIYWRWKYGANGPVF